MERPAASMSKGEGSRPCLMTSQAQVSLTSTSCAAMRSPGRQVPAGPRRPSSAADLIAGFPEVRIEAGPPRHADAPVFVEVTLTGTHQGEWARIPATGRQASVRIACLYEFEQ